ncbi:MAG TPA: hypothetical protein VLV15_14505, partial [Dongiaceae bacterium]|nr:hypothetical protein [Dongiaceae bacterium]
MNVDTFVRELESLGVRLWEEEGKLRFRAPSGVITDERREVLRAHKDAVLASLRGGSAIVPDPDTWYEPFPLTDVQAAYLVGRNRGLPFGGVGCHAYGELTFDEIDP